MRNRTIPLTFCSAAIAAVVLGLAAPALAQEPATPAESSPPPVVHHRAASGNAAGLGLGATGYLSGGFGPEVVYDFGLFHLAGMLAFDRDDNGPMGADTTQIQFGVSGWYHLHMGASSDFSVGGGIAYAHNSGGGGSSAVALEPGAQVRAFLTPNVALSARLGFVLAFDDSAPINDHFSLTAQPLLGFGFTYFFGG